MRLHYVKRLTRFVFACEFEQKEIPKRAGFRWDRNGHVWATTSPAAAANLIEYADAGTRAVLANVTPAGMEPEPPEVPVLSYDADRERWVFWSRIGHKDVAKSAGFRWDKKAKRWVTSDPGLASALASFATPDVRAGIEAGMAAVTEAWEQSRAVSSDHDIPAQPRPEEK